MPKQDPPVAPEQIVPSYPAIEKLVASEDLDRINKSLGEVYTALEKISKEGGMGKARDAKKGMKAIDKVIDLLKELVRLKQAAMRQVGGAAGGPGTVGGPSGVSTPQSPPGGK